MAKIIDTHSHILPGIDDGAGSWKEALCMLKTAQAQGIRRVIATPHWGGPFGYTDPVQIRELCFTLQEKARRHNISVKIYQGQEVMYTEEAADRIANGEILTLADSRYVLAEFYQGIGYSGIFRAVQRFTQSGYSPIIAHAERYEALKDIGRLEELRKNMEKTHDEEMAIDLWELISALKKRALIILAACLLGGVVAGVYTKLCITPMYTATSSMLVTTQETTLTSIADLQLGSALTGDYSILATSRSVLEEVIEDLGLNMNHHQLRGSITITNPEGTHIMEVTARSSDPETAKKIADTMAVVSAQYIKEKMEVAPPKIIEEAEVPSSPVSPSMNKNVMMGALAGFALAAAIVILFAIMNDSIKTEDDIERALGIPTLAVIPDRKDYIDDHGGSKKKKGKRRRQSKWRNKR